MSESLSMQVFDISASALAAERTRLAVISQNIANAQTTAKDGDPYRRQKVTFSSVLENEVRRGRGLGGLPAGAIRATVNPVKGAFESVKIPGHPHADQDGNVLMPNVNVIEEMVDMVDASRTYEANLSALRNWKQMLARTLEITR